jgi:hypothetical protein
MISKMQTGGYVTGFRTGEMVLENGTKLPIVEFEYRPHPTSPDQEAMGVQLTLRSEVAMRFLQAFREKLDQIDAHKNSMN